MTDQVKIELTIEEKQALSAIKRLADSVDSFGDKADKNFKKSSQAFNVFKGALAATAVTRGITLLKDAIVDFASSSVSSAKQLETIEVGFTTLLKSSEAAKKMVEELTNFTAATPFQLEGVTGAAQQLLAFGFAADTISDKLQKIGDVAAGSNSSLQEVAMIYGQVAAAGKLTGERLLQFQERAVPIGPALAETMGIAESAVKDAVSAGKVDLETFEKAFASLSGESGLFFEGMVRKSKTLDGVLSTLSDNFDLASASIGEGMLPVIKTVATELIKATQEFIKNKDEIKAFVTEGIDVAITSLGVFVTSLDMVNRGATLAFNGITQAANIMALGVVAPLAFIEQGLNALIERIPGAAETFGTAGNKMSDLAGKLSDNIQQDFKDINEALSGDSTLGGLAQKIADLQLKIQNASDTTTAKVIDNNAKQLESDKLTLEELNALRDATLLTKELERATAIKEIKDLQELEDEERIARAGLVQDEADTAAQKSLIDSLNKQKVIKDKYKKEELVGLRKDVKNVEAAEKAKNDIRVSQFQSAASLINALGALAATGGRKTFEITKALTLAAIPIDTAGAIMKTLNSPLDPFSKFAQAAAVGIMGAAQLIKVSSSKPPAFADGGMVPGTSFSGDNQMARVNAGELILNQAQQENLASRNNGPITFIAQLDGREIFRSVYNSIENGLRLPQGA